MSEVSVNFGLRPNSLQELDFTALALVVETSADGIVRLAALLRSASGKQGQVYRLAGSYYLRHGARKSTEAHFRKAGKS